MTDPTPGELNDLIAEATIDAHDMDEQCMGFFYMIEEHLAVPFTTTIFGVSVTVEGVTQDSNRVLAQCVRGAHRQTLDFRDLTLPSPAPAGAEWVAAYRRWASRQ